MTEDPRRALPAVDTLLSHAAVIRESAGIAPEFVTAILRVLLAQAREQVGAGEKVPSLEQLACEGAARLRDLVTPSPRRVINATGIVLHTGLGRAPLAPEAQQAVSNACGYCDLELDLGSGERGDRQIHTEELLRVLTGAESALVVNNNAAALYLVLNTLCHRREVIVSRGQLIEIGGSFRLPDIMTRSGVRLVEVGTTNRTRLSDYRNALSPRTAALLHVHPSNFRIQGFTESASLRELVALGREHNLPVFNDLGNGLLWDWSSLGLPAEDNVRSSLEDGADLVMVSGDKILGGPQAGIIVGRRGLIERLKKSPLARVVRPDKLTISALAATLRCFLDRRAVAERLPVWKMLTASFDELYARALCLRERLAPVHTWRALEVRECSSEAGSGSLPTVSLRSAALAAAPSTLGVAAWARRLRRAPIPVIATARADRLWFDVRTILPADEEDFLSAVASSLEMTPS